MQHITWFNNDNLPIVIVMEILTLGLSKYCDTTIYLQKGMGRVPCVDGHSGAIELGSQSRSQEVKDNGASILFYFTNTYMPVSGTFLRISSYEIKTIVNFILQNRKQTQRGQAVHPSLHSQFVQSQDSKIGSLVQEDYALIIKWINEDIAV